MPREPLINDTRREDIPPDMTTRYFPVLLLILLAYIVAPSLWQWVNEPQGVWYRPFLIWIGVIVAAFLIQERKNKS